MPSLVTSVIGGFQGASAAHNAANAIKQGYTEAGQTVTQAAQQVNPDILKTAVEAGDADEPERRRRLRPLRRQPRRPSRRTGRWLSK